MEVMEDVGSILGMLTGWWELLCGSGPLIFSIIRPNPILTDINYNPQWFNGKISLGIYR